MRLTICYLQASDFRRVVFKFPPKKRLLYANVGASHTRQVLAVTMTQISNLSMIALFALLAESAALLSIVT
jgi:hypothetical protein